MNWNWNNIDTTGAQAICLRGGAYVSVTMAPLSVEMQKDFVGLDVIVDHDPGGSDG